MPINARLRHSEVLAVLPSLALNAANLHVSFQLRTGYIDPGTIILRLQ